jgi:hypothetical protein
MLLHSLGLVYKSMRGVMTNSIDRDQWLNVTSEYSLFFFALGRNRTRDPRVPEPKRTPLGYILPYYLIVISVIVYVLRQNCRAAGWRWDSPILI